MMTVRNTPIIVPRKRKGLEDMMMVSNPEERIDKVR